MMLACVSLLVLASRTAIAVQLRASQPQDADASDVFSVVLDSEVDWEDDDGTTVVSASQEAGLGANTTAVSAGQEAHIGGNSTPMSAGLHSRLELHLMKDKLYDGAVCLDGSAAAFYFAPASDFGPDNENKNDWQIAFEGGGWCYGEQDCIETAQTGLGSSNGYTERYNGFRKLGGFMSDNCTVNPTFCQYNKVLVMNCDATSFTGDRSEPVEATDKDGMPVTLHFRGAHILRSVLDTLFTKGLQDARNVVLTGYSSGGLSTLLHADYVRERLIASARGLLNFRAVPISGFFLDQLSEARESGEFVLTDSKIYNTELKKMVELANSTGALNQQCVKQFEKQKQGSAYKCIFAPNAYGSLKTPVFVVNSGIDQWQISYLNPEPRGGQVFSEMGKIPSITDGNYSSGTHDLKRILSYENYSNGVSAWRSCFLSAGFGECSENQVNHMMKFHTLFAHVLKKHSRNYGNGAFVHTCPLHDEAMDDDSFNGLIVGGLSIQESITNWWTSPVSSSTIKHTTLDCHLDATHIEHACNPTCPILAQHSN